MINTLIGENQDATQQPKPVENVGLHHQEVQFRPQQMRPTLRDVPINHRGMVASHDGIVPQRFQTNGPPPGTGMYQTRIVQPQVGLTPKPISGKN